MATQEGAKPRLVISEMVLENFKSYAGAQRVGPFHKCFSSVVGPNGSGKSNVIDAMLFVFGKRAKQLRLNKVSELIHNSTHHRDLEMAKVSVFFEEIYDLDDDAFKVVPGSAFSISRTAHRSNKSDYYIGERKSNFTEVTDLLKGKGIDLDNNRFLILQGEVEQISMMRPKGQTEHETGLLEYLEDIVGTDRYVADIEAGAKLLEELNERRQGMLARVKIAEREREGLEADKAAAEAWLAKERACLGAQAALAQVFAHDARRNVAKIEANLAALEERLSHEKAKHAQFAAVLEEHEARYNAVVAAHAAIQAELDAANAEFKEFERKDIKYREDLKHGKGKLKKLEEKLARDAARLAACEAEAEALAGAVPALEAAAAAACEALAAAEASVEALTEGVRGEVEALRAQLRGVRGELAPWEARMTQVQSRIDVAASERGLLRDAQAGAVARLADAKVGLKAAAESASNKRAQAADMEATAGRHRAAADAARAAHAAAAAEAERLEASSREVRGRAAQRRADASSRASQGAVVSALMEARAAGAIEGIHGRLGDLGAVDARYDVAASTAAPALDYIVVDSTAAAQRCVELLRRRQLGVATFLILEKQAHLAARSREAVSPPEGAPRLFDLVRPRDDAARLAFFYAMGNTLVVDDVEAASRIAYSGDARWRRVVTTKGEMINESGTMSGGGKPRSGKMCLGKAAPKPADARAAAAELAAAEAELEAATAALGEARAAAAEATAEAKAAERALAALETSIPKTRMEAEAAAAKAADLQERMAQLEAATKVSPADAARVKALEAEIAAAEGELAELKAKSESLSRRAAELEAAVEAAGGPELKRQRAAVARLAKEIASAEAEATKKGVQAAAASKQAAKLAKDVAKAGAEREALAAAQAASMAEFKALEDAAFGVLEVVRSTQGVLAAKEAELEGIRGEYEARQREVSVIRQVEVDIANEADLQRTAAREEGSKLKHWAARAGELAAAIGERDGAPPAALTEAELAGASAQELQYQVTVLEEEMQRMSIDVGAIEAWRAADAEYGARVGDLEGATAERDGVRRGHEELRKRRLDEFMAGFNTVSLKLKEMYQMITMGGDAELELVDSLDPFSEGILFSVRPPKKSWKNIANLSGGEKTLSSLSLVFALHHYKPTPLYVMDEIDAALDFKNVSIVGHYIKERTKNAQFIIISLRNNMFELADRLVGIYKTDNATKSVAINPGRFAVGPAAAACGGAAAGAAAAEEQEQRPPAVAAA